MEKVLGLPGPRRRSVAGAVAIFSVAGLVALAGVAIAANIASKGAGADTAVRDATRHQPPGPYRHSTNSHRGHTRQSARGRRHDGPGGPRPRARQRPGAGQAVAAGRPDRVLRCGRADRHHVHARSRRGGITAQRRGGRGHQRPEPAGEPVRPEVQEAARGVPTGPDAKRRQAALRDVFPLRRGIGGRPPDLAPIRADHARGPDRPRGVADPAGVVDGPPLAGRPGPAGASRAPRHRVVRGRASPHRA